MGICSVSARFMMIALSVIFWIFAAGCMFIAVELFVFMGPLKGEVVDKVVLLAPGSIMVVLSILLFIIGMIGLFGACKEGSCLKGTFCVVLMVIIGIEIAGVVCGIIYKDQVKDTLKKSMEKVFNGYKPGTPDADAVDTLQSTLQCCGVQDYKDWFHTAWGRAHIGFVPESCCKKTDTPGVCTGSVLDAALNLINTKGCNPTLYDDIHQYLIIIIAVAVVFALIQIVGLGCTCFLLCSKKREVPYQSLNTDSGGYRA